MKLLQAIGIGRDAGRLDRLDHEAVAPVELLAVALGEVLDQRRDVDLLGPQRKLAQADP